MIKSAFVDKNRTVSDTKRDFYAHHTRPINSIYRRFVEELMVEMHLLSVNVDFRPEPLYYLGVVTSFQRFMEGYTPEKDKESIFQALCQALGTNVQEYRQQADKALAIAKRYSSADDLVSWLIQPTSHDEKDQLLADSLTQIVNNQKFKYSRLFTIGLYTLLETTDSEFVNDHKKLDQAIKQISEFWHISEEKINKDIELYRGNLDKIAQLLIVLKDTLEADRKKREQRLLEKN